MDGFRFDLASCLCRDSNGNPMAVPPLIRDIAKDPVLSKVARLHPACTRPICASTICCSLQHCLALGGTYRLT